MGFFVLLLLLFLGFGKLLGSFFGLARRRRAGFSGLLVGGLLFDGDALYDSSAGAWLFADMIEDGLLGVADVIASTAGKGKGLRMLGADVLIQVA